MGRRLEQVGDGQHLDVVVETRKCASVDKTGLHGSLLHLLGAGTFGAELRTREQVDGDATLRLVLDMALERDQGVPFRVVALRSIHAELDRLGGGVAHSCEAGSEGEGYKRALEQMFHWSLPFWTSP